MVQKYKIGDKVRLINYKTATKIVDELRKYWQNDMLDYLGKTMTIQSISDINGWYYMKEDEGKCLWPEIFIKEKVEETAISDMNNKKRQENKHVKTNLEVLKESILTAFRITEDLEEAMFNVAYNYGFHVSATEISNTYEKLLDWYASEFQEPIKLTTLEYSLLMSWVGMYDIITYDGGYYVVYSTQTGNKTKILQKPSNNLFHFLGKKEYRIQDILDNYELIE